VEEFNPDIFKGIKDEASAFCGPKTVQIDLTGKCNSACLGCWVHSTEIKNPPHDKNITLSFSKVKELIEELSILGTQEIYLSGAGEPFLHPNILDIIELIKSKGIFLNIITNFTLVNAKIIDKLISLGVDSITASIWAGSAKSYVETHPKRREDDFYAIKDNLMKLAQVKRDKKVYLPKVKIYNVINNLNFSQVEKMVDFAKEVKVSFIEFQIVDVISGQTDYLALTEDQKKEVKIQINKLNQRDDLFFKEIELTHQVLKREEELKEFGGRFVGVPKGFALSEETQSCGKDNQYIGSRKLTCSKGVSTRPSVVNPIYDDQKSQLLFTFPKEECSLHYCPGCSVSKSEKLGLNFLRVLGLGSFSRRVDPSSVDERDHELAIIDKLPCYMGWVYSRILSTGEVIPCCKAALKPLGNINEMTFTEIWHSNKYKEFRKKAKNIEKSDVYFKEISCYKSCDNVGMNLLIHEKIKKTNIDDLATADFCKNKNSNAYRYLPKHKKKIIVKARKFNKGNLNHLVHNFGKGVVIDGGEDISFSEYEIKFKQGGEYEMWSYYASEQRRPVAIYFDNKLIKQNGLDQNTLGWNLDYLRWFKEVKVDVTSGRHVLKISSDKIFPHLHSFAFIKSVKKTSIDENFIEDSLGYESSFSILKNRVKTHGFFATLAKGANYIRKGKFLNKYGSILGIFDKSRAFVGPFHVQIDLTNDCNNDCIGCWCNSPLLEEKTLKPEIKKQTLPLPIAKKLIDQLFELGTKEIYFSGGGEPFMHPHIFEILEYAKQRNFICYVNTNFTLLDKKKIERIIDLKVDHLTVSTWAGTAKTYAKTHPNKSKDTFKQIVDNLKFLNDRKKVFPYVKLYNVIFNLNYHELKEMVSLAQNTNSDSLEFTLIDTIPDKTDKLLLNNQQIIKLQADTAQILEKVGNDGNIGKVHLFRLDSFIRRIKSDSDLMNATYDRNIIDKMPCYVGWCFSRILPNGDVNPCLKAHRIPSGNLYQESFETIWNGKKQIYFRNKTLVCKKSDDFFKSIGNDPNTTEAGCYKSCDDVGRNHWMHKKIISLARFEKLALKFLLPMAKFFRLRRKDNYKDRSDDPVVSGIIDGKRAYSGPEQVVIDVTNKCNLNCVACWLHSSCLEKTSNSTKWLREEISTKRLLKLMDEFKNLGTKIVRFTGGGEPFMHKGMMDVIERAVENNLDVAITTNLTLVSKPEIEKLISLGVKEICISVWASNKDIYELTHPGVSSKYFDKICENLKYLQENKTSSLKVTFANVIMNLNCKDFEGMYDFAIEHGADGVYFTIMDLFSKEVGKLVLNKEEKSKLLEAALRVGERNKKDNIDLEFYEGFLRRISKQGDEFNKGDYDCDEVDRLPCYAGWVFSRILADGGVAPCCRGVKKIMGNIKKRTFGKIWHSNKYNEFRNKAKNLKKDDKYFIDIECKKECDNLIQAKDIYQRVSKIS